MVSTFTAFVSWPSAPLTNSLVNKSLSHLNQSECLAIQIKDSIDDPYNGQLLQWATYDALNHELTLSEHSRILASSYTIRKALIRKNYLNQCIDYYNAKHKESTLRRCVPKTWHISISFADELDDMWSDELWELGEDMRKSNNDKWWILKPAMADGGKGLHLFNSKELLQIIVEGFEVSEDFDFEAEDDEMSTSWMSDLREFVIQEYLDKPLLLEPSPISLNSDTQTRNVSALHGRKFHLRAYCVASGALSLYLFPKILALFASEPYQHLRNSNESINMAAHLTNTSLQQHLGESGVRLLCELADSPIYSDQPLGLATNSNNARRFTNEDIQAIIDTISHILAETFQAALQLPAYFQPLPNAFELYGVDFLVNHNEDNTGGSKFQVSLLEINAEPAIEMTGPRLSSILEQLFDAIGEVCIKPFFQNGTLWHADWPVGETRCGLRKCFDSAIRAEFNR